MLMTLVNKCLLFVAYKAIFTINFVKNMICAQFIPYDHPLYDPPLVFHIFEIRDERTLVKL